MKAKTALFFAGFCVAGFVHTARAVNIAGQGFPIMGVTTAIDSSNGVPWNQGGGLGGLTDGILTTRTDTFNGDSRTRTRTITVSREWFGEPRGRTW